MQEYIKRSTYEVGFGDSVELIPQNLEENSIHAVVTDPPY
jgi:tRNA G10  N-methylase Trm11